ncbi:YtxH domain-containing protein [Microtetraspora niveoalba]|uniref:YtxH domain-containing protein n=1 Tax=Microtetraspora niveoalba TaxID=46175 RepID=UPI00082F1D94|nr:YtxH domain-containing protein [Microtetraspora niveoalba]
MSPMAGKMSPMVSKMSPVAGKVGPMVGKVTPMMGNARDVTATRITDARVWAAPKLDQAACTVEEQLAPRVSSLLHEAARRVDPGMMARTRRRWPMLMLFAGLAIGVAGAVMYRNRSGRWTESMKDTAAEATRWAGEKAEQAGARAGGKAEQAGGKVGGKADEIAGKIQ